MAYGWGSDWPSGYGFFQQIVHGDSIKGAGNSNLSELDDPEINELLDEAAVTDDPAQREEMRACEEASAGALVRIRELAYTTVAKCIAERDRTIAQGTPPELKQVWNAVTQFIQDNGEEGAGNLQRQLEKLAETLLVEVNRRNRAAITETLAAEKWESAKVPKASQRIVNALVAGPEGWRQDQLNGAKQAPASAEDGSTWLVVDQREFRVTNTTVVVIGHLNDLLKCAAMFPSLTLKALMHGAEEVYDVDRDAKAQVLGGGAKTAGKISSTGAKHLSLALQTAAVLRRVMPLVVAVAQEQVPPVSRERFHADMARLNSQLDDHITQLIRTISSLIENSVKSPTGAFRREINDINWDLSAVVGLDEPQPYMKALTENISRLNTVLQANLDPVTIREVYLRLFHVLNSEIPAAFENVRPQTPAGRARIRVDVSHLLSTMRRIQVDGVGDALEVWLESRVGARAGNGPAR